MEILLQKKNTIIAELRSLCAHCSTVSFKQHNCPVKELALRVENLKGIPLVVNSEFRGILWNRF